MHFQRIVIYVLLLLCTRSLNGQIGSEFWFAAPDVSDEHFSNSVPLNLHITAIYNTHVKIFRPADAGFIPVEFDLISQQTQQIRLDALLDVTEIEVYSRDISDLDFLQNKGFKIEASPGEITAYYELEGQSNTDIVALKSNNALGTDFWVSTQRKYKNHGYSDDYSGFVVVATEDGTVVDVDPMGNNLYLQGTTAFSITLNKGQTFSMRAAGQAPAQHINGIRVTSNKDIAITIFDDSMQIDDGGGNWDIFADQIIPVELVGTEYIVLKGEVQDEVANTFDAEAIFITSTEDNTQIWIDNSALPVHTMGLAGDYWSYDIKNLSTHIRASDPVYINHVTGYSTDASGARELGGAILPSIDKCTGSNSVTVKRTPAPGFVFFNNLMVRNDTVTGSPFKNQAIKNFTFSIDGGPSMQINPSHFTYIMDSAFAIFDRNKAGGAAYYNSVSDNEILRVDNTVARFHLGVMQGKQSPGCKYGYFSDYAANDAAVGIGGTVYNQEGYCNLNPIMLAANGGRSYQWGGTFIPAIVDKLDYDSVPTPYFYPEQTGVYDFYCIVTGECNATDSLNVRVIVAVETPALFAFSDDELCSPEKPELINLTNDTAAVFEIWTVKPANGMGDAYEFSQDSLPRTFELELPDNTSDTVQIHTVELIVSGPSHSCPTIRSKAIKVLPRLNASFTKDKTQGCHPFELQLFNKSGGHVNSNSFTWDFGDNSQSFTADSLYHSYTNYGAEDSTYIIQLLAESPFGCRDSITDSIIVHPRVKAAMAINTSASCSPLNITIDPTNSIGVDTLIWRISSPTLAPLKDTTYRTTSITPINLYHQDTTYISPDTLHVNLVGVNDMGCTDTLSQKSIIVYPEVTAQFNVDKDIICDADSIAFQNNSLGFNLFYEWDFDDGTIFQDITGNDTTHTFFNRSSSDSTFYVTLKATSGYNCESIFGDSILVHPYVKANFGLDYSNNCTPILADFSNLSIGGDSYEWDFGDDSTSITGSLSFTHQYWNNSESNDTTYFIELVAIGASGCADTLERTIDVFPHVVAEFTMSDSIGCSPLSVDFKDTSSGGNNLSLLWDFGNGTTSTNPSPLPRSYTNYSDQDTSYYISLTAINPNGCNNTFYDTVDVYSFIDADFNLPRTDSCSPFILRAENLSSDGAGFYEWDLLNSGILTDHNVTPDFGILTNDTSVVTGVYDLQLVAFGGLDAEHRACADTHTVEILLYPELNTDFELDTHENCQPLLSNIINNTNILATGGTVFQWFIDSTFYSVQESPPMLNIPNLTSTDEQHIIMLMGESKHGCTDVHYDTVDVYSLVDAKFTINKSDICSAESFEIDRRTSRGGIEVYTWDFAGVVDSLLTDDVFTYSFENTSSAVPLVKPIRLTVRNSHYCTSSIVRNINVNPEVRAGFDIDTASICYPYATTFYNNTENASNHAWDFGDGTGSNDTVPDPHTFSNFDNTTDASYTIKLVSRSDYNCYDSTQHDITIFAKPDAEFMLPVSVNCPPFIATTDNLSEGNSITYLWDFGDGSPTSTEFNPTHPFSNATDTIAKIPITLYVTSARNCKDTIKRVLSIYPDVEVDFTMSESIGCSPLEVDLNGITQNVNSMLWFVNGEAFSELEDPSREFTNITPTTQEYEVKFQAYSSFGCSDDTTKIITVYSTPTAEFIPQPQRQTYNTEEDRTLVTFKNETLFNGEWSYLWDFGDGNNGDNSETPFDYYYGEYFWGLNSNGNEIPVSMVAWNSDREECMDSVMHKIIIRPPAPEIDMEEDVAECVPFTLDFAATVKYADEDSYEWNFDDGSDVSNESEPIHTFTKPGNYDVVLAIRGDGGTNWDSRTVTVYPKPVVDFSFNDSSVFVRSQNHPDETINFYNSTTLGETYDWYFELPSDSIIQLGDYFASNSANSIDENPTWFYSNSGIYYVGQIATTEQGCMDTLVHPVPIHVQGEGQLQFPTAFYADPNTPTPDDYTNKKDDYSIYVFRGHGDGVEEYRLEIYNRWGVLVFKSDNINKGWNGYIDGSPAKQDVYVWRVKGKFTNGESFVMSGDVTLFIGTEDNPVNR